MKVNSYNYYEVEFKGKKSKNWSQLTIEFDKEKAKHHLDRLQRMGYQTQLIEVTVIKRLVR